MVRQAQDKGHPSAPSHCKPSSERPFLERRPRIHIKGLDTLTKPSCGELQKTFRYELPVDAFKDPQLSPEPTSGCRKTSRPPSALCLCGLYLGSSSAAPCMVENQTDKRLCSHCVPSAFQRSRLSWARSRENRSCIRHEQMRLSWGAVSPTAMASTGILAESLQCFFLLQHPFLLRSSLSELPNPHIFVFLSRTAKKSYSLLKSQVT